MADSDAVGEVAAEQSDLLAKPGLGRPVSIGRAGGEGTREFGNRIAYRARYDMKITKIVNC